LTGAALVFKVITSSEYEPDTNNPRFEIITNWYQKPVEERAEVFNFIKNSG
jgi:hypothetical protein